MRTHQEIFEALAAPFPDGEIKHRPKGGRQLAYITARMARRRLNEVLGPFRWNCEVEPTENWVICTITITLDDGTVIVRSAMGGYPDMPDHEDRVKGGDSDAFKRCCALYGIGEYLYDEPDHGQHPGGGTGQRTLPGGQRGLQQPPRGGGGPGPTGQPTTGSALYAFVSRQEEQNGWPAKTLVKQIDEYFGPGSSYNHPRSWKEWDKQQVAVVFDWLTTAIDGSKDEDKPAPAF